MKMSSLLKFVLAFLLFFAVQSSLGMFSRRDYGRSRGPGRWYYGDGTYYGWTNSGNCAIRQRPWMYRNLRAVAINSPQYSDSQSCGACVEYEGLGRGSGADPIEGPFIGYVHDRCPECRHGSLDLSQSGDGRWDIKFRFVPCPFRDNVSFLFEGSNRYYWKIQPRGIKYPARRLFVNGRPGSRTQDNFFEVINPAASGKVRIKIVDVVGRKITATINHFRESGVAVALKGRTSIKTMQHSRNRTGTTSWNSECVWSEYMRCSTTLWRLYATVQQLWVDGTVLDDPCYICW